MSNVDKDLDESVASTDPVPVLPRPLDRLVGSLVADRYRVLSRLGQGGMGVVYCAQDQRLERKIALKVLPPEVAHDPERVKRFIREARTASAVTHAHIAAIFDVGEDSGRVYLAMELIEGTTLRSWLEENHPLPIPEVLRVSRAIAMGLAKAHEAGIVHRDLKPENVMVGNEEVVKILDFGLAKILEPEATRSVLGNAPTAGQPLTEEGAVMGTPGYMSPEQARGRKVDARSDVFTMGIIVYELATGLRPFNGETSMDVVFAIAQDTPEPPALKNPLVTSGLERLILRCLEKDPAQRFADARQLAEALKDLSSAGLRVADSVPSVAPYDSRETAASSELSAALGSKSSSSNDSSKTLLAPVSPASRRIVADSNASISSLGHSQSVDAEKSVPARKMWLIGPVVACLIAGGFGIHHLLSSEKTVAHSGSAAPVVASSGPVSMTDFPPPTTQNSEARTAYVAALQAMHDGNWQLAEKGFRHTIELDSSVAMAHFRLAMTTGGDWLESSMEKRSEYQKAVQLRSSLGERDRAFLDALEPILLRSPADSKLSAEKLTAALQQFPNDAEMWSWLGWLRLGDPQASLEAQSKAILLDPRYPDASEGQGRALFALGRIDEALKAFDTCAAFNTGAVDCLNDQTHVLLATGKCKEAEANVRRALDREPASVSARRQLANALYSNGSPALSIHEALAQAWAATNEADRPLAQLKDEASLAMLEGDFEKAEELAKQEGDLVAGARNPTVHFPSTSTLMQIASETGDAKEELRLAEDHLARREAWSLTVARMGQDPIPRALAVLAREGKLSVSDYESRLAAWGLEHREKGVYTSAQVWAFERAATATKAEAVGAIANLAKIGAPWFLSITDYDGLPRASVGRVYALADQPDEAIAQLSAATATCLAVYEPWEHTRAELALGDAWAQKGDSAKACAAYQIVIDRWGKAKPRSLSADRARTGMTVLHCAKK